MLQSLLPRNKVLRFHRKKVVDKFFHSGGQIASAFYIRPLGAVASLEKGAQSVKLFSPELHAKRGAMELEGEEGEGAFVLAAAYNDQEGLFVALSSGAKWHVWDCACKRAPKCLYS